jgi:putative serine protease PepD
MNNGSQNPQGQPGNFPFGGPAGPAGPGSGNPNGGFNGGQNNNPGAHSTGKSNGARTWVAAAASAIIAALLVLGLGYAAIANGLVTLPTSSSTSSLTSSSGGSGTAKVEGTNSPDWASVNKNVAASVVSISAEVTGGVAKGSGAIIDTDGNIVTNNHVIEGAKQIQVSLSDGKLYSAKLVGTDTTTDLAVIKLQDPPSNLQAVTFADSSNLAVGESVMAIGNPLGYENTATTGIVSALNRPVSVTDESSQSEIVTNAIQIDASINPGNSGGPTFNAAGQVVGINSSIATASTSSSSDSESGSIGIGFAIPSTLVQRVAKQIVKSGKATHAQLGVTITTGTAEADGATLAGAKINSVTSGGPAAKAGLQKGDVIVGFDGNTVSSMYSLLGFVRAASVGDTVKLTVVRNSKTVEVDVTLTEAESTSSSDSSNSNNDNDDNSDGDSGSGNSDGDGGSGDGGLSDPFGLFGDQ